MDLAAIYERAWEVLSLVLSSLLGLFIHAQRKLRTDIDRLRHENSKMRTDLAVIKAMFEELQKDNNEIKQALIETNKSLIDLMRRQAPSRR